MRFRSSSRQFPETLCQLASQCLVEVSQQCPATIGAISRQLDEMGRKQCQLSSEWQCLLISAAVTGGGRWSPHELPNRRPRCAKGQKKSQDSFSSVQMKEKKEERLALVCVWLNGSIKKSEKESDDRGGGSRGLSAPDRRLSLPRRRALFLLLFSVFPLLRFLPFCFIASLSFFGDLSTVVLY